MFGPLIGAAVFTLLPELLRGSASWRYVVFAAGVIVLMALRPQGLITRGQFRGLFDWRGSALLLRDLIARRAGMTDANLSCGWTMSARDSAA